MQNILELRYLITNIFRDIRFLILMEVYDILSVTLYFKGSIIFFDCLLLCRIFSSIVHRYGIRLASCILYASRVRTIGCEVTNLGYNALAAYIDVLGVASALVGYQIRTDVERELCSVGASARELGVHVELFTLTGGLHRAFTVGIIPVVGHESVVVRCK